MDKKDDIKHYPEPQSETQLAWKQNPLVIVFHSNPPLKNLLNFKIPIVSIMKFRGGLSYTASFLKFNCKIK
jgi:hypothetical protein